MFCSGCARQLPSFRANGRSMLSRLNTSAWRQLRSGSAPQADRPSRWLGFLCRRATNSSWLAGVTLLATSLIAALAWNGLSSALPKEPAAQAVEMPAIDSAPSTPLQTMAEAPPTNAGATTASVTARPPPEHPPPRRPTSDAGRSAPGPGGRTRPAPSVQPPLAPVAGAPASGQEPRDPQVGCQHLFFAFAARCTANHCLEAAYTAHPHCDQVRAETQRDETRRNMTLN